MTTRNIIKNVLKQLINESEEDTIHITGDKYRQLLEFASWDGRRINNVKGYKGKTIVVDGDVDLVGTPLTYFGDVTFTGRVRVENSQLKSKQGATFSKYSFTYYNTPYYQWVLKQEFLKKKAEQQGKREEGVLDTDTLDETGLCALALYEYLIQTEYEEKTPEDSERLKELYAEKERREEVEKETEDNENLMDLEAVIEEIDEIEKRIDVYDLHYEGNHYYLKSFKLLTNEGESRETWAVGDEYQTKRSAFQSIEDLIDDVGVDGLSKSFVEDYIDEEELKDYFRDGEYDNVRENEEDYFDEDDFEYTDPNVQDRIDEIEVRLEDSEIDQEDADELNEELDELKNSNKSVPEHLIDDKVESLLDDLVSGNALEIIQNYGLTLSNFVNMRDLIEGMIKSDGYGHTLNNYDGSEDTIEFNDETYYIFQIDG